MDAILDARGNTNRRRISSQDAKAIRKALLDNSQLKLTTRFVDGIAELVNDDFFLGESAKRQQALPRSQLEQVLRNLYKTRSGYVHELRGLHDQLRTPGFASDGKTDLFVWDSEPYLTLAGVVRLTHHVLRSYLRQQPQLEKERYPQWRKELPGIVTVEFAPRYWIWQAQGAIGENAHSRFSGVVSHFIETFQKADGKLTDLRDLVSKIESILGQTKADNRKSLFAIYVLWNSVIVESARSANRDKFLAKHGDLLESCSVQSFAVHLILGDDPVTWAPDECESCVREYERRRHKRNAVSFPRRLEIALAVETANRFRDAGDHEKLREWMRHAKMDAAGMPELQSEIDSNVTGEGRLSIRRVLGFHREGTE